MLFAVELMGYKMPIWLRQEKINQSHHMRNAWVFTSTSNKRENVTKSIVWV